MSPNDYVPLQKDCQVKMKYSLLSMANFRREYTVLKVIGFRRALWTRRVRRQ